MNGWQLIAHMRTTNGQAKLGQHCRALDDGGLKQDCHVVWEAFQVWEVLPRVGIAITSLALLLNPEENATTVRRSSSESPWTQHLHSRMFIDEEDVFTDMVRHGSVVVQRN